jgi:hypothetical protein
MGISETMLRCNENVIKYVLLHKTCVLHLIIAALQNKYPIPKTHHQAIINLAAHARNQGYQTKARHSPPSCTVLFPPSHRRTHPIPQNLLVSSMPKSCFGARRFFARGGTVAQPKTSPLSICPSLQPCAIRVSFSRRILPR